MPSGEIAKEGMEKKYAGNRDARFVRIQRDGEYNGRMNQPQYTNLLYRQIHESAMNADLRAKGYTPVYTATPQARIVLVGQAPGRIAQHTLKPWNDMSGRLLRQWLGVSDEEFYNPNLFALIPMDFYYPGKGKHGDKPPRKEFAPTWHPQLLALMPDIQLTILVGSYAQRYYLGKTGQLGAAHRKNLTETVASYEEYLPQYLPLVHPSPLTIGWRRRNPWFEHRVLPHARQLVRQAISTAGG